MRLSELLNPGFAQMLDNLAGQLDKADEHAHLHGSSFEALLGLRLADDMFPLEAQIRFSCVQAGEAVHRLLGAPSPEVPEIATLADAKGRIGQARNWLTEADPERIDASAGKSLVLALPDGISFNLTGDTYIRDWAVPQFYFHLVTAYAIMRHAGVPLGKADYVPHMFAHAQAMTDDFAQYRQQPG